MSGPTSQSESTQPHVVVQGTAKNFFQEIVSGTHHLTADEPVSAGGTGAAPDPYDYLMAALGSCTSMTIGLHARRRNFPLEKITVSLTHSRIHARDCEDCLTKDGMLDRIDVEIELTGALTPEQHAALMTAAEHCPVHKTLTSEIKIRLHSKQPK
jgi:uncharacterized OsmC-like protein